MIKSSLVLFMIVIGAYSADCQNVTFKFSPLTGTWVETTKRLDTLVFNALYEGETPGFVLNRPKRAMPNGHPVPDFNAGYYRYFLAQDTIKINSLLSSDARFKPLYFTINKDKTSLMIGNFFAEPQPSKDVLTFIRIK